MKTQIQHTIRGITIMVLLAAVLTLGTGFVAKAASDDPGAGRLSGQNIPEEFYETDENSSSPFLRFFSMPYGSSVTGNAYTGKTYTHADAFDNRTILNGIDVSQWQKSIDWNKVKADGIDYAFIRVGYRGYGSAGTLSLATKDTYFDQNMKGANAAGIPVGIYIFSQAITEKEAQEEAQYILDAIGSYTVSMPLIMDYEYASDSSTGGRLKTAKLSKAAATKICNAFCKTIADAGYTPMVYANKSMLETQLNASDITKNGYRIWLANYTTKTDYTGTYDFWQYSSSGKVDGISGKVDMNFYYVQDGDNFKADTTAITSASIAAIPNQAYTGSNLKPVPTISYEGKTLTVNQDYTLSYSNNKKIGKASVKISGTGHFKGTKTVTFKIVPKTISKLKTKKRSTNSITISWSKNTSGSGYQIYRATAKDGTYKKLKTIKSNKTTSYQNTKLTAGQCYYYKVRSYKKVNGTTYYGAFSPVTTIYTKLDYTKYATAKSDTFLYKEASGSADTIKNVPKNTSMTVTYATKDAGGSSWYYVSCETENGTQKGFILAKNVTITMKGKITKTNVVNVRKSTSTKSKSLTTLKRGKKVTVLSKKKKKGTTWYKVTFKKKKKTYTGWISAPFVKLQ